MNISTEINPKLICFYLPQFHPVRDNDEWWGKGFTEWRNVSQGRPQFPGHYQPHTPADLGFYDLRLPEAREAQAELAREHGIHGFCYYHYWFNGRRILERPFNEVLAAGKPDFPFCLCWANENWTRVWDGGEKHVLLGQNYNFDDDRAHIKSLIPAFRDERYIRVNGKSLFLVYRTELLPDPARTAEIWREEARKAGIGDLYLVRVEGFKGDVDPAGIGFDAAVEFAPDWRKVKWEKQNGRWDSLLSKIGLKPRFFLENYIFDYQEMVERMLRKPEPEYVWFRCVAPSFDNSVRRKKDASVFIGSTPEKYEFWLRQAVQRTKASLQGDERLVFINAWNEWGEGNHLEPDLKWGRGYLEATRKVLADNGE